MRSIRLRSYTHLHTGELQIETAVLDGADLGELPRVGDVVQLGVELPPVPGLRGTYAVQQAEISVSEGDLPTATFRLGRVSADNQTLVDEARLRAIVERDHGEHPDWAAIWDQLEFLPSHRRPEAMADIQTKHRDRLIEDERRERIAQQARALAEAEAALADAQRRAEVAEVQQQVKQILHDKAAAQYRPKPRKIDLGED